MHRVERHSKIPYKHPKFSESFTNYFSELLAVLRADFNHVVIAGDFNIHTDNPTDKPESEFGSVLETFDLLRHVKEATHKWGHVLDLVISKMVDTSNTVVKDIGLSDHFCVFFEISDSPVTQTESVFVRKQFRNELTAQCLSPFTCFLIILKALKIIDVIAPRR